MVSWRSSKHLAWDAISPDTFAPSYLLSTTSEAETVAAVAESKKKTKYSCLGPTYSFSPVTIETSGACGPLTLEFLRDLSSCLRQAMGEESSFAYLLQRLSVAVQRSHAASVLGTSSLSAPPTHKPLDCMHTWGTYMCTLILVYLCTIACIELIVQLH